MATFGTVNNGTVDNTATDGPRYCSGVLPSAGILTDFFCHLNSGFAGAEDWRLAVYQGGASGTDPTGATLIWQSGQITFNISSLGWYSAATTFGLTPTGSLAAVRTWLMIKCNNGVVSLNNSTRGDFDQDTQRSSTIVNDASVAYPTTWPSEAGGTTSEAIKAYITYTASVPAIPIAWLTA